MRNLPLSPDASARRASLRELTFRELADRKGYSAARYRLVAISTQALLRRIRALLDRV